MLTNDNDDDNEKVATHKNELSLLVMIKSTFWFISRIYTSKCIITYHIMYNFFLIQKLYQQNYINKMKFKTTLKIEFISKWGQDTKIVLV
jgi:hypothetical protein